MATQTHMPCVFKASARETFGWSNGELARAHWSIPGRVWPVAGVYLDMIPVLHIWEVTKAQFHQPVTAPGGVSLKRVSTRTLERHHAGALSETHVVALA